MDYILDPLDTQKTTYVRYPKSSDGSNSPAPFNKVPFQPLLDGLEDTKAIKRRYKLFMNYWNQCEERIQQILNQYHQPLLDKVVENLKTPIDKSSCSDSGYLGSLILGLKPKIPTLLMLSGTNIANHQEIIDSLTATVESNHPELKLVSLDSKTCGNVKTALKSIIFSIYGYGDPDLKTKSLDFDVIRQFCTNYYQQESLPGQAVKNVKTTNLKIVVLIKNLNTFSQAILQKLLFLVQKNADVVPFKLILNVPSFSITYLESHMLSSLRQLMVSKVIRVSNDSNSVIDKIFEAVVLEPKQKAINLMIGPKLIKTILARNKQAASSTQCFINCIKYVVMSHYFSSPLCAFLSGTPEEPIDLFDVHSRGKNKGFAEIYLDYLRHLPSFQNFVGLVQLNSKLFNSSSLQELFNHLIGYKDDLSPMECLNFLVGKLIPFSLQVYQNNSEKLFQFLEFLTILQDSVIINNEFLSDRDILSSNTTTQSLKFEKISKIELYCFILNSVKDQDYIKFIKLLLNVLMTLIPFFLVKLIRSLKDFCKSKPMFSEFRDQLATLSNQVKQYDEGGSHFVNIFAAAESSRSDGLKDISLTGKIQFEKLLENFNHMISQHFFGDILKDSIFGSLTKCVPKDSVKEGDSESTKLASLMDVSGKFHEIRYSLFKEFFLVENHAVNVVLSPAYRKAVEGAMSTTRGYFPMRPADYQEPERKKRKTDGNTAEDFSEILDALQNLNKPMMVEMFKLYREAPLHINIFDYYESFKSVFNRKQYFKYLLKAVNSKEATTILGDEEQRSELLNFLSSFKSKKSAEEANVKWDAVVLALFLQNLADLRYIGIFKESRRQVEAIEKGIWRSL
ncbi:hypothetical protein DASC09_031520 [Saccharomycopsis crataegensis]|uniref:Origin recognition complex subunit 3 n=1 Tax=Saccharomycopsis crataegensis TaxID=43959 RepID=A0AAV5QMR7_9ASCO|nr:hypothetical protein DASC09_031520 [Saccharomycopsis crataegensis]